jgi:hypothetical protein
MWEHSYYFANPDQVINELESFAGKVLISESSFPLEPPEAPQGFVFDEAEPPQRITGTKWMHRFRYKPANA